MPDRGVNLRVDEIHRSRLRGLAGNPGLPLDLLRRVIGHPDVRPLDLTRRRWSDETFDFLAAHPDARIRQFLARTSGPAPEQRARLIDDPSTSVVIELLDGPYARWAPTLPDWAYRKLARDPRRLVRMFLAERPDLLPPDVLDALRQLGDPLLPGAGSETAAPAVDLDRLASSASAGDRRAAAGHPGLPARWIGTLAADPDPDVRLHLSMRPGLTEPERAAIACTVTEDDRIPLLGWVLDAGGDLLDRCVRSAHPGLRRSAARNKRLTPAQIELLGADDDFPVRLLLCEQHAGVPAALVVDTYLEAQVITRTDLLWHPALAGADLTGYADSPDWNARAIVVLDRRAPAELIERLSHDEDSAVRKWVAGDERLTPERALELFAERQTTSAASANPNLPVDLMEQILAEAAVR
ncbi:hypothetical protein B0I29_12354 [Actinoplanes lutulentus]|uniref:Leucine rich repeat (LRR) protein n=2 Tax=Actinoplanes lutulentus TaxID=1287878 RepID=A0A327YZY5_9ACTN|nr:hypothetical protein B0I29_12354 [Actinoplanes lutulentus]